ncbi:T9SS type A sorting domain-containing protein [Aureispira anguillae]|uniref:T9SS type A sorting domain-containing protein n=1 Tax=Aureispira anguillae TaxID=2864201 RepID=A0A916DUU4_9BACT|nr:T9SS type A sorting domain-containing protein [Aureispira anguillae]BDS12536.1 T9SS type A sorting domain-containing protein [Aureispira anguillae]
MNLLNVLFIFLLMLFLGKTELIAQNVTIPDANFKAYLVGNTAINTNGDTEIQVTEASAFSGMIDCSNLGITDLTGIETFVNLTILLCTSNNLTSLDLSHNTKLSGLACYFNALNSLDLSQNPDLDYLDCSANYYSLTSLDLSQNTKLSYLDCSNNYSLASLDLRNGNNTMFTNFDASYCSSLTCVDVDDVAYSTANWTQVDPVTSFSSNCSSSTTVYIPDAALKTYLIGNTAINTNGDGEIQISEAAAFSGTINCSSLGVEDLTGIEAFVNLTALNCSHNYALYSVDVSQNVNLTTLTASHCYQLYYINVTQSPNLVTLDCGGSDLYGINVTQNPNLITLNCSSNSNISSLDLSQNTNLVNLNCALIDITSLNLSQNSNLEVLDCSFNTLNSLDLRNGNNTNITTFNAAFNASLNCIDVDNVAYSTANWTNIDAGTSFSTNCNGAAPIVNIPDANFKAYLVGNAAINTNGDTEIQVTEATAFGGRINCPNRNIASLTGIEAFVNLTQLICYRNNLTSLDVSQNTNLNWIHCVGNSITSLDLTQNTNLGWLYCSHNPISSLNVTQNSDLKKLYCGSTQLTSLDLTQNSNLKVVDCSFSTLSSLNIKNGNNTNITTFNAVNNSNLSCIEVDDPAYSTMQWINIDAGTSFSTSCGPQNVPIPNANFSTTLSHNQTSVALNNTSITNEAINLKVYPNPTTKSITLDFGNVYSEANIQITNLTGQIVLNKKLENSSTTTLALEGAAGVYFINIQTEEGSTTTKVIKE